MQLRDGDGEERRRRVGSERGAAARDRCRAVLLAGEGVGGAEQTGGQIAAAVGRGKRFIDKWLARYRAGGLAGLEPGKAKGNEAALTREELARLKARVKRPAAADGGKTTRRGKDARRVLAEEFGRPMTLGSAHRVLHRAGLSCLRPRPRHRKNDPGRMAAWLDRAPPFVREKAARPGQAVTVSLPGRDAGGATRDAQHRVGRQRLAADPGEADRVCLGVPVHRRRPDDRPHLGHARPAGRHGLHERPPAVHRRGRRPGRARP